MQEFDTAKRNEYKAAVADVFAVAVNFVNITSVSEYKRGRRLLSTGILVSTEVHVRLRPEKRSSLSTDIKNANPNIIILKAINERVVDTKALAHKFRVRLHDNENVDSESVASLAVIFCLVVFVFVIFICAKMYLLKLHSEKRLQSSEQCQALLQPYPCVCIPMRKMTVEEGPFKFV